MYCDKGFDASNDVSYYMCKNLVYFDNNNLNCYVCSITGEKCRCQGADGNCAIYEKEEEE